MVQCVLLGKKMLFRKEIFSLTDLVFKHVNYFINIRCEKLLDQWCSKMTFLNSSSQIQCSLAQKSRFKPHVIYQMFCSTHSLRGNQRVKKS